MKENIYKKVEYYLYNYKNIDNKIDDIRDGIIDSVNISTHSHLIRKNSVEEQAIKLAENKRVYNLRKIQKVIQHYLEVFRNRNPKRYCFIKMKYFDKATPLLYCDMLDNLGNGFVFTNNTKVSGTYFEKYVEDTDKWTTITYYKEIQLDKLPKTRYIVIRILNII